MATSTVSGTGFDVGSIVSNLMLIERQPLDRLTRDKTTLERRASSLKDLGTKLTALKTKLSNLAYGTSLNAKTVTTDAATGSAPIVTASASNGAASGSFKVTVDRLATATTVQATQAIGQPINAIATLSTAGFGLAPTSGTFRINGTAITIDATVDTLNDVIGRINANVSGVTASIVNDSDGRPNKIQLTSAGTLQLGSGADTSNFLTASKLLTAPISAGTAVSTGNLGVTQTSTVLQNSRLGTSVTGSGSFQINGTTIAYNASTDSLNTIIGRINSSSSGITAAYDSVTDRIKLTANGTGSIAITLNDMPGSNFLTAAGLLSASQNLGQNALYRVDTVDGGAQQSSAANTVSTIIPGVTLKLMQQSATPVTVTVNQDTTTTVNAVKEFVTSYNETMSYLRSQSTYNSSLKVAGAFNGDSSLRAIESQLKSMLTSPADGITGTMTKLADLGVTFGAVGSAAGTTTDLVLDEGKLKTALEGNPYAVAQVFNGLTSSSILKPGGTGSLASINGTVKNNKAGSYAVTSDGAGALTAVFTPADGSASLTYTGSITAGGTNTTLIPGVTLTANGTLTAGTNTITVANPTRGVAVKATEYLTSILGNSGLIKSRTDGITTQQTNVQKRIDAMNTRLDSKEEALTKRYAALNTTLTNLQRQAASISAQLPKP